MHGLLQALNSTKAYAVVLNPEAEHGAWQILRRFISSPAGEVQCPELLYLRHIIVCTRSQNNDLDFLAQLRAVPPAPVTTLPRVEASDIAVIFATSGSTGFSKLAPQRHSNLLHIMRQVQRISQLRSGERFINCSLLGWAAGFPLWYLGCGSTRVFVDCFAGFPQDMAAAIWHCVQQEKCVYAFLTPMYVAAILDRKNLWQWAGAWRLRGINVAGQPMKRAVVAAAVGAFCDAVDINYGTTECGVIATGRVTAESSSSYVDGLTGPPAFGVDLRIVDEDLKDVPMGQTGEVLARSPALYGSYIDNPEASARSFTPDGWFRTDDVGYQLPDDGGVVHLGRRSDAISRGVYLCYPGWLEALLCRAPGVADVCVVPVPDQVLHHEICACIVPAEDPPPSDFIATLRDYADSQLLTTQGDAQHMAPKYYIIVDKLALTPTGKISRKIMAELAATRLGMVPKSS